MATVQEKLSKKIFQIQGVTGFILVRDDGQILASKTNTSNPETLASLIILSGLGCNNLKSAMGFSHYNYLMLSSSTMGGFFVFPVKNYFLGVIHQPNEYDPIFIKRIKQFIRTITKDKA